MQAADDQVALIRCEYTRGTSEVSSPRNCIVADGVCRIYSRLIEYVKLALLIWVAALQLLQKVSHLIKSSNRRLATFLIRRLTLIESIRNNNANKVVQMLLLPTICLWHRKTYMWMYNKNRIFEICVNSTDWLTVVVAAYKCVYSFPYYDKSKFSFIQVKCWNVNIRIVIWDK